MRATSAASTYFANEYININGISHKFIDGGVYRNNPTCIAL